MAEMTWKAIDMLSPMSRGLDFSKGFQYKNQDLDEVHSTAEDIKSINDKKLSGFLWEDLSSYKLDDKWMDEFIDSLDYEKTQVASNLINKEGFSNEAMVAYIKNRDMWENPKWSWMELYQKKWWKSKWDFNILSPSWMLQTLWGVTAWLLWLEWAWRWLTAWGNSIYNDWVRPTDKDVETLVWEVANSKKYEYHNKRAENIKKEMDKLVEWDPKREELNKQYNKEITSRDRYTPREKSTTVELMNEAGTAWDNFDMAADTNFQADKHWTEKVEPYMEKSTKKFNKSDYIEKLTRDLFKDVDDYTWEKQYAPVIEEMKQTFAGQPEVSLKELHEWKQQYKPSNKMLAWDTAQTTMKNINDKMYSMLTNEIKTTLDEENPWMKVGKAYSDYGKWLEAADESLGKAQKELTKDPKRAKWIKSWLSDKIRDLFGTKFKTRSAQALKKIWKAITPSQWISGGKVWAWVTDVIWVVQLLRLVPWTIWDLATQFIEWTPAWVADEMLWDNTVWAGIQWWSWNRKSDDERIDFLKENLDSLYWIEFPRDDIEYSYYKWKGNTDWNLHIEMDMDKWYFAWWQNNEALPVFVSNEEKDREYENERLNETVYKILYMNADSDDTRVKLIMDRYLVDEDTARNMLNNMTAWWDYNKPKFKWLERWTRPA